MLKVMLLRRKDVEFIDLTELPFEVPERKPSPAGLEACQKRVPTRPFACK
jgi:hypothetical protein